MLSADLCNGRLSWNSILVEEGDYKTVVPVEEEKTTVGAACGNTTAKLDNLVSMMEARENLPQTGGGGAIPKQSMEKDVKRKYVGGFERKPKIRGEVPRSYIDDIMAKYKIGPTAKKAMRKK